MTQSIASTAKIPFMYLPLDRVELENELQSGQAANASAVAWNVVESSNAKALKESNERLQFALSAGCMGIWEIELSGQRVRWSKEISALFGLPAEDADVSFQDFERIIHTEDRAGVWEAVRHAVETWQPCEHDYRVVWPDGQVCWMRSNGSAVYDAAGVPARLVGTTLDVTPHRLLMERERVGRRKRKTAFWR